MSESSYRLERPRSRMAPPALHFQKSSSSGSSILLDNRMNDSQTLLYDQDEPAVASPAGSRVTSPTSPTFSARGSRTRTPGLKQRPTPPPSGRNRSATPLGVARSDLEKFGEYCREWYFNQDDESGRLMTQTLAAQSPAVRAPFARLQASVRATYHANVNARRMAEFLAHLSATSPGGSLSAHARADPSGSAARKERYDRLDRFVQTWCSAGLPGCIPFFEALWAVMRLLVIPEHLGGAGGYRVQWEIDDAVFRESAGKDFMLEAIDVLKGVLAFEETLSSSQDYPIFGANPASPIQARSQSHMAESMGPPPQTTLLPGTAVQPKRARAPSDPFLDTPALSQSLASTTSRLSGNTAAELATPALDEHPSPSTAAPLVEHSEWPGSSPQDELGEEEYMRTWTSPNLTNAELTSLLKVFPSFVSRRQLPRFPIARAPRRPADIEEGEEDERGEGKEIRFGTGSIWRGSLPRADGWNGGLWSRFVLWLRSIFC